MKLVKLRNNVEFLRLIMVKQVCWFGFPIPAAHLKSDPSILIGVSELITTLYNQVRFVLALYEASRL